MEFKSYLDENGVRHRWFRHAEAHGGSRLAEAGHIPGDRVIKPVVVNLDGEFVMCALPASHRVELDQLRRELRVEEARLATEEEIAELCDCELGSEPPIGWLFGMPTLMDESIFDDDRVTFPAGRSDEAVTMRFLDYYRLAQPVVGHFSHRVTPKRMVEQL